MDERGQGWQHLPGLETTWLQKRLPQISIIPQPGGGGMGRTSATHPVHSAHSTHMHQLHDGTRSAKEMLCPERKVLFWKNLPLSIFRVTSNSATVTASISGDTDSPRKRGNVVRWVGRQNGELGVSPALGAERQAPALGAASWFYVPFFHVLGSPAGKVPKDPFSLNYSCFHEL